MNKCPTCDELNKRFEEAYRQIHDKASYAVDKQRTEKLDWLAIVGEVPDGPSAEPALAGELPLTNTTRDSFPKLLDHHLDFLLDLDTHKGDGLRARYTRMAWGIERGNRVLGELKAAGLLTVKEVPSAHPKGGHGRLVAALTKRGEELLKACGHAKP